MMIFTKEILNNQDEFINITNNEKTLIYSKLDLQKKLKEMVLNYMQKFADSSETVENCQTDIVFKFLEDLKNSLNLANKNIFLLEHLLKSLDAIISVSKTDMLNINLEIVNAFNKVFFEASETIEKNTLQIETFFSSILPFLDFTFVTTTEPKTNNLETSIAHTTTSNKLEKEEILELPKIDTNLTQHIDSADNQENTLIISEQEGKVYLPYTQSSLNDLLKNHPEKYTNIDDIKEKEYTLSLDSFSTPSVSRFREAFKLMRKKEKKSIREAFDLGMELFFNYNLHPAIIAGCRNLDELDIYLDYLENNESHKFNCFKIVFHMAPTIKKSNSYTKPS